MRFLAAACVLVLLGPPVPAAAQRFQWWHDADVRRQLALTPQQVEQIEQAFRVDIDERRRLRQRLDRADASLATALERGDLSDDAALELVTRVEDLRRRRNVARSLMLMRLYRLLSPEQRRRLPALREETLPH